MRRDKSVQTGKFTDVDLKNRYVQLKYENFETYGEKLHLQHKNAKLLNEQVGRPQ